MKRIISLIIAVLMLLSAASCAAIPDETKPAETKEKESEVTYEEFKGETGNYSGAEFTSIANMSVKIKDVYGDDYYQKCNEYYEQSKSLAAFYDRLYQKLLDGDKSGAVSPVNIYMALSLLAECTDGNSRKEILDTLGVSSIEQLREQSKLIWLYNNRDGEEGITALANSIWLKNGLPVKESCVNILKDEHYASTFTGDFAKTEYVNAFKQWLSDMTKGLLDNSINGLNIPAETAAILASTLYYKASWWNEYKATESGKFDGKNCTFNKKTADGIIYSGKGFTAYADGLSDGNRIWFFLPDKNKTVSDVLGSGVVSFIKDNRDGGKSYEVTVRMPDFDVSLDKSIKEALSDLGITECMDPDKADFSALSDGDLYLDNVIHAARVKANKDGVEGAAYTVMTLNATGMPEAKPKYDFTLDRPFVFVVENNGTPLFVGCVNEVN